MLEETSDAAGRIKAQSRKKDIVTEKNQDLPSLNQPRNAKVGENQIDFNDEFIRPCSCE